MQVGVGKLNAAVATEHGCTASGHFYTTLVTQTINESPLKLFTGCDRILELQYL